MTVKPKKKSYIRASFAFKPEDTRTLKYCSVKTELSQTEVVRRLTSALASGAVIRGLPKIPRASWSK